MDKRIVVKPSKGISWLQVVATTKEKLEPLAREAENLCMEAGADCRVPHKNDKYDVVVLRDGVYHITVPCPSEHRDRILGMEEPPFRLNRQQAYVQGARTYFDRHPYLVERDVNTNANVNPAPLAARPASAPRPVKVIVSVPAEDKFLIEQIARDLCKAKGL